jgi:hypothetical protein
LRGAANRLTVVDDHDLQALQPGWCFATHVSPILILISEI